MRPEGIKVCLDRLRHLNQEPFHFHLITPPAVSACASTLAKTAGRASWIDQERVLAYVEPFNAKGGANQTKQKPTRLSCLLGVFPAVDAGQTKDNGCFESAKLGQ